MPQAHPDARRITVLKAHTYNQPRRHADTLELRPLLGEPEGLVQEAPHVFCLSLDVHTRHPGIFAHTANLHVEVRSSTADHSSHTFAIYRSPWKSLHDLWDLLELRADYPRVGLLRQRIGRRQLNLTRLLGFWDDSQAHDHPE